MINSKKKIKRLYKKGNITMINNIYNTNNFYSLCYD